MEEHHLINIRDAIFSIRDSLIEIRDLMRLEKATREQAMQESVTAKEALSKMMDAFPPNIRSMMEPLIKRG